MKKKIFSVLIMCFIAVSLVLTGCKPRGLGDNPATEAQTISNGGMSVVKGDYLYFVNGYVDETTIDTTTEFKKYKEGKVTRGAIYRTKLEDSEICKDKDGFLESDKTDLVVSRVVGFSNGGFYIIDDTIYYATPYMMLDKDGTALTDRVEFRSININGDTKTDKQVYVTETHMDDLDWTMYKVDGKVYLLVYCNSHIYSVDTTNGDIVADIKSPSTYAFYHEDNYSTGKDRSADRYRYVYYTRSVATEDGVSANFSGNVVCAFDVTNGKTTAKLNNVNNDTIDIVCAEDFYIYYTKTDSTSLKKLYRHDTREAWKNDNLSDMTGGIAYTSYTPCPFGDYVIASNDNGTYVVSGESATLVTTDSITILNIYGGYAYYLNSEVLHRFQISNPSNDEIVVSDDKTIKTTSSALLDFDGQRLYVFAVYNTDYYYMDYIDETSLKERFVGVFADGETPEAPEQTEGYGEDPDIEYIPHID